MHNTIALSEMEKGLAFRITGEGADSLPQDATSMVVKGAQAVFRAAGRAPGGLAVRIHSDIPLASGLGSSATALLGGVVAANALLDSPVKREDLLKLAIELEGHPDNVTAAMLGGLVISSYDGEALVYKTVAIESLQVIVVLPEVDLSTGAARQALPKEVSLKDAAQNVGRTALVIQALVEGDYALLGDAMRDRLHEPHRLRLIPGFADAAQAARDKGAAAVALSGAGPAMVAFAPENHERIARAAAQAFREVTGKAARYWILPVDTQGIAISEMADEMLRSPRKAKPETVSAPPPPAPSPSAPSPEKPPSPPPPGPAVQRPLSLGEAADLLRETSDKDQGEARPEPAQADDANPTSPA